MEDIANPIIAELSEKPVLDGPLATVTSECVIIRDAMLHSHTIIALSELSSMKRIRTTYPALLVIASGFFLISAAAFYSKEGSGAGIPIALLGGAFALGYLLSRRASILFAVGASTTETVNGSLSEAAALIAAVQSAQLRFSPADQVSEPGP